MYTIHAYNVCSMNIGLNRIHYTIYAYVLTPVFKQNVLVDFSGCMYIGKFYKIYYMNSHYG